MNELHWRGFTCPGVPGRRAAGGGYTAQGKSCPSVLRAEVSAVMLEVFPLWGVFLLNVLSLKGSEQLNTSHHKSVAKPQRCPFSSVPLCSLKDALSKCWARSGSSGCAGSCVRRSGGMVFIIYKGKSPPDRRVQPCPSQPR